VNSKRMIGDNREEAGEVVERGRNASETSRKPGLCAAREMTVVKNLSFRINKGGNHRSTVWRGKIEE
jgi:hypothetical protein